MSRQSTCTRRTALRALGAGAGLVATGATVTAQEQPTFDGWLDGVGNYDGVVDETGADSVTVQVGSQANGGAFGFSPPAVRVDPGTEVVWEWTGDGGVHNVLPQSGDWGSELVGDAGHTYSRTFEESQVVKYSCEPHEGMGMKGVVVVGDAGPSGGNGGGGQESFEEPDYGGWFDDVGNYESTANETGADSVTVQVGSQANGGGFGFAPPAVRVDPGTEVVWEWTGDGGVHNVLPQSGDWGSELVGESGHTYSRTFEEPGIHRYSCEPHEGMGMKGAVVVTGAADGGGTTESADEGWTEPTAQPRPVGESRIEPLELAFVGGFGSLLLFPALVGIAMGLGSDGRPDDEPDGRN
ncbi:halocyanin domain-containing protein [Haloarchaeobius baliensis]|uniref:halocyanin domain-containing protein n=1 Tax=Haloarchaeobius baliensis TaxID=1670458 RepID=UPI003F8813F9